MSEFIESITPPPDENRNSPNAFSNDDVITRAFKSVTVSDLFSPIVPTAIKRFYNANEEIKEQERSRSEVSSLASTTGFEVFPSTYKQTKVGSDNMSTNYLDTISNFFGSTVGNIASGLENFAGPVNRIGRFFGSDTNIIGANPQAITMINPQARETQNSGERAGNTIFLGGQGRMVPQQAFVGGLGSVLNAGRSLLRSPIGQVGTGLALGGATSLFSGGQQMPRITRRMRSEVRRLLMATNGNYELVAQFMNQSGRYPRINFTPMILMDILVKRFRNDGSFVTKAAVRKTRSTIRKLKSMKNLLAEVSTTRTVRRRTATGARSNTTLIRN
jgi:hypothetical protein